MQQAPDGLFGYGDPRGSVDLRTILSSYLARVRGVLAPREQICVSTGFAQALRLACDIFRAKGIRRVAIEDPSHPQMRNLITRAGMALMPIPVDEQGIRVDELAKSGARAVVVGPAHQYPLGVVMSPQRRAALVRWARDRDGLIVEDDYDAEFRYDRAPIGAVQGLAPEYVLHVGTVSKSLAPGLRLGWLSAPSKLVSTVMEIKSTYDIHSPVLDQLTIAHLIETGRFDRHIRKVRQQYRARRDTIVEAITAKFPDVRVRGISAGIHVLVELPSDISEDAAVSCAAAHSVRCVGLAGHYAIPGPRTPGLVLGYTSTAPHSLGPAIRALLRGLEDARCAAR
ncbi:MAG: PLP-dependent aminotransferase family protein [Actinomycetota bacterium]|nr:PLP-dependent aminotransferase family protein [Actinomycetota bacterium]